ncbi:MAG: ABC transporter permease, partial [Magnetospirillum sp.]|nr:ABC transporter permease [Magnetospirillum sp.]
MFSPRRVGGMILRHLYILKGSWPRLLEMAYWPALNMVVWGFTSQFFLSHSDWLAQAAGVLIGAVILWDVMFRGNLGVALSFLEEMWSRNLGHLSVIPLRPYELVTAMLARSMVRPVLGVVPEDLL